MWLNRCIVIEIIFPHILSKLLSNLRIAVCGLVYLHMWCHSWYYCSFWSNHCFSSDSHTGNKYTTNLKGINQTYFQRWQPWLHWRPWLWPMVFWLEVFSAEVDVDVDKPWTTIWTLLELALRIWCPSCPGMRWSSALSSCSAPRQETQISSLARYESQKEV